MYSLADVSAPTAATVMQAKKQKKTTTTTTTTTKQGNKLINRHNPTKK